MQRKPKYTSSVARGTGTPSSQRWPEAVAVARATKEPSAEAQAGVPQRAPKAPPWKHANNSPAITESATDDSSELHERQDRRAARFAMRATRQAQASCHPRGRTCGRVVVTPETGVVVRDAKRRPNGSIAGPAGLRGVATCGSVWACPTCASKIAAVRTADLTALAAWAESAGCGLAMVTLTVRHHAGQSLRSVWDAVVAGWAQVTSGSQWGSESRSKYRDRLRTWYARGRASDRGDGRAPRGWRAGARPRRRVGDGERYGVVGWVKATEVTAGEAGWHVHLHVLVLIERGRDVGVSAAQIAESMWCRWSKGIEGKGFTALRGPGVHVTTAVDPAYLGKGAGDAADAHTAVALEIANGPGKVARGGESRSVWELLASLESGPADRDVALWAEWEAGSYGRRQMAWSRGLRRLAGLGEEHSDEEIAAEEVEGGGSLITISASVWHRRRLGRVAFALLDAVEWGGRRGAIAWCEGHGVPYMDARPGL